MKQPRAVSGSGIGRRIVMTSIASVWVASQSGDALSTEPVVGPGPNALLVQDDPTGPRGPINPAGKRLAQTLDGLNVESLWIAGFPVDWRTGESTGPRKTTPGGHTHCSAFAAAVADRLGIYLLRPPEHPQMWLANAQEEWLNGHLDPKVMRARDAGWLRIGALAEAGTSEHAIVRANQGHLVVAVYFQPPDGTRTRAGHVAIVRPSEKPADLVRVEGPDVTQAGEHNYRVVPMREGFAAHKAGWRNGAIEYFRNRAVVA